MTEEWRPVVGWEGLYEVSSEGRVRRLRVKILRADGQEVWSKSGIRKGSPNQSGHLNIQLRRPGGGTLNTSIHRIVCEAFHGPAPEGKPQVLHWDDDPTNNRASNLRWGDNSDNQRDAVRNKKHPNTRKSECKNGHPLSGENLRVTKEGRRECVICGNRVRREWKRARTSEELTQHGTPTGYAVYKCRCHLCSEAASKVRKSQVESREIRGLPVDDKRHGTMNGYKQWRCRCEECRRANRDYEAQRKRRIIQNVKSETLGS